MSPAGDGDTDRQSGDVDRLRSIGTRIGEGTNPFERFREWILVKGDRLLLSLFLSTSITISFVVMGELGIISFANDDSITRLAGGMIAGTLSLVTLVVSINQLILSQEFTTAGETRETLDRLESFRTDVAEAAGVPVSPASPARLLGVIVTTIERRAQTLAESVSADRNESNDGGDADGKTSVDGDGRAGMASRTDQSAEKTDHDESEDGRIDDDVEAAVSQLVVTIEDATDRVHETLGQTAFGSFRTVSAAIEYDDAWQLYVTKHLRSRHENDVSPATREAFDELIDVLELFSVAREHFKTTYLQRELTRFSQLTIYSGVPAVLSAIFIGLLYADVAGPSISLSYLPYVVSVLIGIVVTPLTLLVSFILRTATITRRTASVGPMLPQKDPGEGAFDVSVGAEHSASSGSTDQMDSAGES